MIYYIYIHSVLKASLNTHDLGMRIQVVQNSDGLLLVHQSGHYLSHIVIVASTD